jgi:hypothetical protein
MACPGLELVHVVSCISIPKSISYASCLGLDETGKWDVMLRRGIVDADSPCIRAAPGVLRRGGQKGRAENVMSSALCSTEMLKKPDAM